MTASVRRTSGRSGRALRDYHKPVGGADRHVGIIRAEIRELAEMMAREQRVDLVSVPATHHEVVVADACLASRDQLVLLGNQQLPVLMVERRDACEGQLATRGRDTLSEERLPALPFR